MERLLWGVLTALLTVLWLYSDDRRAALARIVNKAARPLPDSVAAKFWRDVIDEYDR